MTHTSSTTSPERAALDELATMAGSKTAVSSRPVRTLRWSAEIPGIPGEGLGTSPDQAVDDLFNQLTAHTWINIGGQPACWDFETSTWTQVQAVAA